MLSFKTLYIFGPLMMMAASHELQEQLADCPTRLSWGSFFTKIDMVLKGYNRENLSSLSFVQCSLRCVQKNWCISINFEISKKTGRCQLNDYGVENKFGISVEQGEFGSRKGFIYSQLRPPKVSKVTHIYTFHNNILSPPPKITLTA
jgi:hypothetical protein